MITDHTPPEWARRKRRFQDKAIAWGSAHVVRSLLGLPFSLQLHRWAFEISGRMRLKAPQVRISSWDSGPQGGLIFTPKGATKRMVWFHGGGFVLGSPHAYRAMLSQLARLTSSIVIAPRYRLAPEHPFPAAAKDAVSAAIAAQAVRPDLGPLHLGGDSAGGNLALVVLANFLERDVRPASVVLVSPATLLDPGRPVTKVNDLLFPLSMLKRVGAAYLGDADPNDPRVSPSNADFPNPPPVLIHCAKGEYLEHDTDLIAARLDHFGADVTIERAPHMPHVWHFMGQRSPMAVNAIRRIAAFMDHHR